MTIEVFANSPVPGTVAPVAALAGNGGQVSPTATTFNIAAVLPSGLQSGGQFHAVIDHELVIIPCQTGTTLTGVTRGPNLPAPDTCASAGHSDGAEIFPLLTAGVLSAMASSGSSIDGGTFASSGTGNTDGGSL